MAPPETPVPGGVPGGRKSAHFFGYLITLPVGTEFLIFGLFWPPGGYPPIGPMYGGMSDGIDWGLGAHPVGKCL